jgi:hypothetical protein
MPIDSHLPQADPFSLVPTFKAWRFLVKSARHPVSDQSHLLQMIIRSLIANGAEKIRRVIGMEKTKYLSLRL